MNKVSADQKKSSQGSPKQASISLKNKLFLFGFGLLIALILIETGLRFGLTSKQTTIQWQNNDVLGSRLIPNQSGWYVADSNEYKTWIEVNSEGWRDVEHFFEKPENTTRILILGDSFVENFQVPLEETFFRQLEDRLNSESDNKYEIIAMGLGNTGTAQQYIVLKEYGLKYNPDLVIQLFYTNDIKNNSEELNNNPYTPYLKFENNRVEVIPPKIKTISRVKELLKKSRIVELLLDTRQNLMIQKENKSYEYPIDYHAYDMEYINEYKQAWKITEKVIQQTKILCDVNKVEYLLVTIPAKEQVDEEIWKGIFKKFKIDQKTMDLEKPDKLVADLCTKNEIDCVLSLPYFKDRESKSHENSYYPGDGHWTESGTDAIADFLEGILISFQSNNPQ